MFGRGGTIQIARIFGIRIGVTTSWLVVLFLLILGLSGYFGDLTGGGHTQGYLIAVAAVVCFYGSLIFHELGHALIARRRGIDVDRIDLWFFGGVAHLRSQPRSPGDEFAVAAAGPVATALVFVVCLVIGSAISSPGHFVDVALASFGLGPFTGTASPGVVLLSYVAAINCLLLVFNVLPGFPLDGGRMALAIAWKVTGDRNRATSLAGRAGLGVAYALGAYGLYLLYKSSAINGILVLGLAWMLSQGARAAVIQGSVQQRLHQITLGEVMDPHPLVLDAGMTVLEAQERVFENEEWPFVALSEPDGRFAGVLRRDTVEHEIASGRPALPAREAADPPEAGWGARADEPLETVLSAGLLPSLGAIFVVDGEGLLRGVVTVDHLRQVLAPGALRAR